MAAHLKTRDKEILDTYMDKDERENVWKKLNETVGVKEKS